jgi:hypothetical protein
MSELKITGNPAPVVGKEESYSVTQLLPTALPTVPANGSKPNPFEFPVEWTVHVLENGRWIKKEENDKTGNKVSYKFSQLSLTRKGIRILAKKGEQIARLDVKPHNAESPKIDRIEFLDKQGKKPTTPLAYGQTLKARIHCLHMERRKVYATLWEDNDKSKANIIIETRFGTVLDGVVDIDFTLRPSGAHPGLNKDKSHKYYVTTVVNKKNMPSNPVNVKELEPPVPPFKKKTPIQQPNTPTATVATKNGVSNVYITDINGQPIQGTYKSKKLKVWIESKGLQGKEIKLAIYDEDVTTNDLIYLNNFKISKDLYGIEVHLDKLPISKAGRLEGDIELFVDIEVLQNQTHTKSGVVNVDAKAFKQDSGAIVNTVLKIYESISEYLEKDNGVCVCKDNNFYWSDQLTCDERKKVLEVCADIWGEDKKKDKASELMAIMHLETVKTFSPTKKGISSNGTKYIGLIQFSATTAKSIGTTYEALGKMTFIEQMNYVKEYLKQNKAKMNTIVDFYLQVIKPSDVGMGNNPDHAVFDESISVPDGDGSNTSKEQRDKNITREPWVTKYGYASNPTFMNEKDEKIKRTKWVYTRQRYEDRYGTIGGKTTIKEIDDVLRNEHYKPGAIQLFKGKCDNVLEEKKEEETGQTAPWLVVAWKEFNTHKGKTEVDSPLKERVAEYFRLSGNPDLNHTDAWCATFIFWCFQNTKNYKDTNVRGNVAAFDWAEENNSKIIGNASKDGWILGEKTDVFVGAIVIFSYSHVAIIVGENNDGSKYVYLGGNQGSNVTGGQKICLGSISKTSREIFMIMKPKNYSPTDDEKKLPKYDVNAENSGTTSR